MAEPPTGSRGAGNAFRDWQDRLSSLAHRVVHSGILLRPLLLSLLSIPVR